jgi:membrane protein DedA with SNARE-associated domain
VIHVASLTAPLVDFAKSFIHDVGLSGLFVLMLLESACIPIPSEATMLIAGANVADGHWSLLTITLVGSVANLVGSWIAYAIGYYGRIELLEKHGRKLHVSPRQLARADRWFERYGSFAVFFSRMLPIVRTFISLPAGVARMPFFRFSALTFIGCVPWVFALGFIGKQVGQEWPKWRHSFEYVDYAVAALILAAIAYLLVRRARGGRNEAAADAAG